MVGKRKHGQCVVARIGIDIRFQLPGRCYAREQKNVLSSYLCQRHGQSFMEDRLKWAIFQFREIKLLERIEFHCLAQYAVVYRVESVRTFRDDDDVGAMLA